MNLTGLTPDLYAVALMISQVVTGLLGALAAQIALVPGFRANDASRTAAMRVLAGVLNLLGVIGAAWTQNLVISKEQLPALLLTAFGATVASHLTYTGVKNGVSTAASATTPASADPSAVAAQAQAALSATQQASSASAA